MLASEFVNTMAFGMVKGMELECTCGASICQDKCTQMSNVYDKKLFFLPRIHCKDGFSISIQVNHCNYCASENGTRTFGLDWKLVEWGFPSEYIDGEKYNAESLPTTQSVGGYVEIGLIDGLCEEHGGVDLARTLQECLSSQ
jgi:hypothetical protein